MDIKIKIRRSAQALLNLGPQVPVYLQEALLKCLGRADHTPRCYSIPFTNDLSRQIAPHCDPDLILDMIKVHPDILEQMETDLRHAAQRELPSVFINLHANVSKVPTEVLRRWLEEEAGIQCYDSEARGALVDAVAVNIGDGTISSTILEDFLEDHE